MKRAALTLWFLAAALLVAANAYVSFASVRRLMHNARLVSQSRDIIHSTTRVLSTLKDAETGQRGFLITNDAQYLEPYEDATANIHRRLDELDRLVVDQPDEAARAQTLRGQIDRRLAELRQAIDARRSGGLDAAVAVVKENSGHHLMGAVRDTADEMRATEQALLDRRNIEREDSFRTACATIIGAGVFNLILIGFIAYAVRREFVARVQAAAHEIEAGRLAAENQRRQEANDALTALATRLEQSNRELQDFASVASHDLQEPLRKIQQFGDRLRTRFAAPLGDEGRDYVARMHAAAARMQTLINDLLAFSRVTTKAQPFAPVDLGQVVSEVLMDLETRIETTGGKVDVDPLPTIDADPVQMRQLFQNLIANALKFHRPAVPPVVRITSAPPDAHNGSPPASYEIRVTDNGIGFDEKYLDRIFNVFQRLHGRGTYEGTGIGLAVCRKIVERHGGTITAHSRENEGSAFVVTLPATHAQRPEGVSTDVPDTQADHHPVGR
jgi:signal transduction histidine kinase